MTGYEVREWRRDDARAWLECQRLCFGEEHAKSMGDWQHAFDPGGHATRGIVAVEEGRVLAALVGVPTRMWFSGEERLGVQWVDLMVDPDLRKGLGGHRLHREVGQAFYDIYGEGAGDLMHYGWPIAAAGRFGKRFLGYQFVREQLCLVREGIAAPQDAPRTSADGVQELSQVGEDLRWLWDRCAGDWGLATIRDAAWARWRFLEHPSVKYRLLGVRRDGHLRGLAVVRESPWHWPGALALCDWLVPAGEVHVAEELEGAVLRLAHEQGLERIVTLLPEFSGAFGWFQQRGWRVQTTPYQLLLKSFDRRLDGAWLQRHGWLTLADSDLA